LNKTFAQLQVYYRACREAAYRLPTRGGTGSPDIFLIALKRVGHSSKQVPHFVHFSWSIT
jgi:hypothetical protein